MCVHECIYMCVCDTHFSVVIKAHHCMYLFPELQCYSLSLRRKDRSYCHLYPPHPQPRPVSVELAMLRGRRGQTRNNGYSSALGTSMRVRESLASACVWARVSLASGFWLPALCISHQEELGLGLIWASPEFSELTSYIRLNSGAQQSLLGILRTIKKDQDDVTFSNKLPFLRVLVLWAMTGRCKISVQNQG